MLITKEIAAQHMVSVNTSRPIYGRLYRKLEPPNPTGARPSPLHAGSACCGGTAGRPADGHGRPEWHGTGAALLFTSFEERRRPDQAIGLRDDAAQ
jgi:hypothetical protein